MSDAAPLLYAVTENATWNVYWGRVPEPASPSHDAVHGDGATWNVYWRRVGPSRVRVYEPMRSLGDGYKLEKGAWTIVMPVLLPLSSVELTEWVEIAVSSLRPLGDESREWYERARKEAAEQFALRATKIALAKDIAQAAPLSAQLARIKSGH